jgi:DNA-binding NarL/FixJ family response regulator
MNSALIVEDLPEVRAWLGDVARAAFPALQVTAASRRDEALACVQARPYDLALIDLGLPDGSGTDVVGALRRHQPAALPVVVTIYDDDDHLFPALQAGAFGYLLKEQPQRHAGGAAAAHDPGRAPAVAAHCAPRAGPLCRGQPAAHMRWCESSKTKSA